MPRGLGQRRRGCPHPLPSPGLPCPVHASIGAMDLAPWAGGSDGLIQGILRLEGPWALWCSRGKGVCCESWGQRSRGISKGIMGSSAPPDQAVPPQGLRGPAGPTGIIKPVPWWGGKPRTGTTSRDWRLNRSSLGAPMLLVGGHTSSSEPGHPLCSLPGRLCWELGAWGPALPGAGCDRVPPPVGPGMEEGASGHIFPHAAGGGRSCQHGEPSGLSALPSWPASGSWQGGWA